MTAVVVLDADGNRILAKYYERAHSDPKTPAPKGLLSTLKEQKLFETGLWEKTRRATGDVLLFNSQIVLYKASIDCTFYLIGPEHENELMLQGVLFAFYDATSLLLRHQVEKRSLLENLDLVVLCLDETVDNGQVSHSQLCRCEF